MYIIMKILLMGLFVMIFILLSGGGMPPLTITAFQQLQHQSHHQRHPGDCTKVIPWGSNNVRRSSSTLCSRLFSSTSNNGVLVDIDEKASRDIQSMDEWATACGVQRSENGFQLTMTPLDISDGVETYTTNVDVSVITNQDLPANTPVLFVPNEMILSSNQVAQELSHTDMEPAEMKLIESSNTDGAKDQQRRLRQYFYLVLKILIEYEKGQQQSPWYPWLNSLPRYFSNGASMTSFCYTCLPPFVSSLAIKERNNFNIINTAIQLVPFLTEETKTNEDLCKWAFQIAYTRSLVTDDGGDLRIVPMVDLFNHGSSAEPEIEIGYDEQGNCYAQTTFDVPAGSPLRISYGDPTNPSHLFARYGFLDESSPATFCKIMIPNDEISTELIEMGYAPNRMLFYKDTGDVSEEVWDVLLYQILLLSGESNNNNDNMSSCCREFYNAHMNDDYETKQQFHQQYWPESSARLKDHLDTFLDQLDKLSSRAIGKNLKEHPRLPLILKHNQFVKNTFLAVKARYF